MEIFGETSGADMFKEFTFGIGVTWMCVGYIWQTEHQQGSEEYFVTHHRHRDQLMISCETSASTNKE